MHEYPEARDLRRTKYGCCSNSTVASYNRRFLNAQQHSNSTNDPWATGSTEVTEAALTGISGMLFVCFLLSVLWLSSLRGIRSCGGRHGLGFRLGLLGLFVFRFLLLGFKKKLKNVSCEYNRLNGWNSTLQAALYIRRIRLGFERYSSCR